MSYEHADLHHPPVGDGVRLQPPLENGDLEDGHPAKQANFEGCEGQDVGFDGTVNGFGSVLARRGRDGVVLEENPEEEGEGVVCVATVSYTFVRRMRKEGVVDDMPIRNSGQSARPRIVTPVP